MEYLEYVEPWHVGAALLVLVAGRWSLWALRKVATLRMALLAGGAGLLYPQVSQLSLDSTALALAIGATLAVAGAMCIHVSASAPKGLSPEAAKVLVALDRMTLGSVVLDDGKLHARDNSVYASWDRLCGYFSIGDVPLSTVVGSWGERRLVWRKVKLVHAKLMAEHRADRKRAALEKL